MAFEICSRTDVGRMRSRNEDSLLVTTVKGCELLAVADGLGGHAAGEVASRLATTELEQYVKANITSKRERQVLTDATCRANREILLLSSENPSYFGMGSTLVAALLCDGRDALVANVGDSRAYLIGRDITQLTRDHSLVQEYVDSGAITTEQAFDHPQKNIVTRTLGLEESVSADIYDVDIGENTLLLCSDGLTDALRDSEIFEAVVGAESLESACSKLVDMANEKGGPDNITVILARRVQSG